MPTPTDVLTRCDTGPSKNFDKCTPMPTLNPTDELELTRFAQGPRRQSAGRYAPEQEAREGEGRRLGDLGGGRELVLR